MWQIISLAIEAVQSMVGLRLDLLAPIINATLLSIWILLVDFSECIGLAVAAYFIIIGGSLLSLIAVYCTAKWKPTQTAINITDSREMFLLHHEHFRAHSERRRRSSHALIEEFPSTATNRRSFLTLTDPWPHIPRPVRKLLTGFVPAVFSSTARLLALGLLTTQIKSWILIVCLCLWVTYTLLYFTCWSYQSDTDSNTTENDHLYSPGHLTFPWTKVGRSMLNGLIAVIGVTHDVLGIGVDLSLLAIWVLLQESQPQQEHFGHATLLIVLVLLGSSFGACVKLLIACSRLRDTGNRPNPR